MTAATMAWPIPDPYDPDQLARPDWFNVNIQQANPHRALCIIDALLKACEARDFVLQHERDGGGIVVVIDGETLRLEISERATAPYRLSLQAAGRTWNDTLSRRLERRLNNVMLALRSAAA